MKFSVPPIAFCTALAAALGAPLATVAQIDFPAPSPHVEFTQTVGTTEIKVEYSRPGMKGRDIFGKLVPYGEVWRTGANQATKIAFEHDVIVEGTEVPAGTYALYTIPGEEEWTVILSRDTGAWGAFNYEAEDDVARVTVTPETLQDPVETFTIGFDNLTDDGGTLAIEWAQTRVPVRILTTDAERIAEALENEMPAIEDAGNGLLFNAASYYRKNDGDLQQAQEWIDVVAERQPDAYWVWFEKAQIEAARGEEETAVESARKALEKARSGGADTGMTTAIQTFIDRHSQAASQ